MQTALMIITPILILLLFIFIMRINTSYKRKILAVTNKVDYLNLKVELMYKLFDEHKKKLLDQKEEVKNVLGKKYDELDEVIIKYLEIA